MIIHHLYADAEGESHIDDLEIALPAETWRGRLSEPLPASGILFREWPPTFEVDFHPAPYRQYLINLDAGLEITTSDGNSRVIGAGEVILVEDTTGKGHLYRSKAVGSVLSRRVIVTID